METRTCDLCVEARPRWQVHVQKAPAPRDLAGLNPPTDELWYLCDDCLSLYRAGERLKLAGRMLRAQVSLQARILDTMPYEEVLLLCLKFIDYFATIQVGKEEPVEK